MSRPSSSVVEWFTRLEPWRLEVVQTRPDDPRLGEVVECWQGNEDAWHPGRPVLLGFPQDEGVRRNGGRVGAAEAPRQIRHWLYRLTRWDAQTGHDLAAQRPLDMGNVKITGTLEESQALLAEIVHMLLERRTAPVILGGGHETAFGHFLGYAAARRHVGMINIDAHLDVRPVELGRGHSGSPFRQALEHTVAPLRGTDYVCLGAQPAAVGREHARYVLDRGGVIRWAGEVRGKLVEAFDEEVERLHAAGCHVYVSLDADVIRAADVPGVSAPNAAGLDGSEVLACVRRAGASPAVASFDLVEINPKFDRDEQSSRWAALAIWSFLAGLAERCVPIASAGESKTSPIH